MTANASASIPATPSSAPQLAAGVPVGSDSKLPKWALWLLWGSVFLYLLYSSFGIAGPFLWGHHGYHGATYALRARMTLRLGVLVPATSPGFVPPLLATYYLHHPIGYHYLLLPFFKLFGDHEWVVRLVAVLGGLVTLQALYRLVRRWWAPQVAVLAVAVYVCLPILWSFSVLSDPMLLEMACCLWALDGFLRYLDRPSCRAALLQSCVALAIGGLLMWEVYFQATLHGLYLLWLWRAVRKKGLLLPDGWRAGQATQTVWRWLGCTFVATAAPMLFHLSLLFRQGLWHDFTHSFQERHSAQVLQVIARESYYLRLLFGVPLMMLGGFWLALLAVNGWQRRTQRELAGTTKPALPGLSAREHAVLFFFTLNTLYIAMFARGASIHLYRVFFYSAFFTLATVDLWVRLLPWLRERWLGLQAAGHQVPPQLEAQLRRRYAWVVALFFVLMLPHDVYNLLESRVMMGTHAHKNYDAEPTKLRFAAEVSRQLAPTDNVLVHGSLPFRVEFQYYLDRATTGLRRLRDTSALSKAAPGGQQAVLLDSSRLDPRERADLQTLLQTYPATFYDAFVMIDLRHPWPPQSAGSQRSPQVYRFEPVERSLPELWLISHKYPQLRVVPAVQK